MEKDAVIWLLFPEEERFSGFLESPGVNLAIDNKNKNCSICAGWSFPSRENQRKPVRMYNVFFSVNLSKLFNV